jgi:hypothetical protein
MNKKKPTKKSKETPTEVTSINFGLNLEATPTGKESLFRVTRKIGSKTTVEHFGQMPKALSDEEILAAIKDVQTLAGIVRTALPVVGPDNSYEYESGAVRKNYEERAAWCLIRLAKVTLPGAYRGIPDEVSDGWDQLGRLVPEIRQHWGWADQDGLNRIPCSKARDGVKLAPLPAGLFRRLEAVSKNLLDKFQPAQQANEGEAKKGPGRPNEDRVKKRQRIVAANIDMENTDLQDLIEKLTGERPTVDMVKNDKKPKRNPFISGHNHF